MYDVSDIDQRWRLSMNADKPRVFNPKKPATVTTIEQANIARQQVVQNHPPAKKKKATNEQGCAAQADAATEVASDENRET